MEMSNKFKKFLICGSASQYVGICPVMLKHIEIEDKSDLVVDTIKWRDIKNQTTLGYNQEKLHIQYSNLEWEHAIFAVCEFMDKNKEYICFETLKEYANSPDYCRESLIFVFAAISLIKIGDPDLLRHKAFLAVTEICKSTKEFFLFVQLRKLLSVNCCGLASGKGFKKTVNKWYNSYEPKQLLLELIRSPSAFKWRHKDLLTLCHISPKMLSVEQQVIFNYIFSNLTKTIDNFKDNKEAENILNVLQKLAIKSDNQNFDRYMERARFIKDQLGSSSYLDFPYHCYMHSEVWSFVLLNASIPDILAAICYTNLTDFLAKNEKLTTICLNRIKSNVQNLLKYQLQMIFAINRCRKTSFNVEDDNKEKFNKNLGIIIDALDSLIMTEMKHVSKFSVVNVSVFMDKKNMNEYKKVSTIDSVHNQIRPIQVASFITCRLKKETEENNIQIYYFNSENKPVALSMNIISFHQIQGKINSIKEIQEPINIENALSEASIRLSSVCLLVYHRITDADISKVLQLICASAAKKVIRVILVGVEFNPQLKNNVGDKTHTSLLIINEFCAGTYPLIKAFIRGTFSG